MHERLPSGIGGLDAIIEGGFPRGRNYFISGSAGSGKTILSCQMLYNGIHKFNEKGLYVSFEEPVADILTDISRFGWNVNDYCTDNSLKFLDLPMIKADYDDNVFQLLSTIINEIRTHGYQRLVLDSLPALGMAYKDYNQLRKDLFLMLHEIRKLGCTTFIITEKSQSDLGHTRFGIEDFLAQGLVILYLSHTYRGLEVRKMRGTSHSTDIHRMRINETGISIFPGDHPY